MPPSSPIGSALVAAALAVMLVVATAGPAWAGCTAPPDNADARIRKVASQEYIGNGVLNCFAPNMGNTQLITVSRKPGRTAEFEVRVRNDGDEVEHVRLRGAENIGVDFKVKYFRGDHDITEKVVSIGGKVFKDIPGGDSTPVVRMKLKVKETAQAGEDGVANMVSRRDDFPITQFDNVWAGVVVAAP